MFHVGVVVVAVPGRAFKICQDAGAPRRLSQSVRKFARVLGVRQVATRHPFYNVKVIALEGVLVKFGPVSTRLVSFPAPKGGYGPDVASRNGSAPSGSARQAGCLLLAAAQR